MIREINGKEYTFRMTRKGIRAAEKAGLKMGSIGDSPVESTYYLWYAALYAEHPMIKAKADELLDDYLDDDSCPESFNDILESLGEGYASVFE